VGGRFESAGEIEANNIALWDGSSWTALGSGTDGTIKRIDVYDGALVVAGSFTKAGGNDARRIARWEE
jgi:hypothetical protein